MNNNGIFRMFVAVGLFLAGQVRAADPNIDAVMRVIDRRMQIDNSTNWLGTARGTFTSTSYDADGATWSITGQVIAIYSRARCCVSYNIQKDDKVLAMRYMITPDGTVTSCRGALRVTDLYSLPFDPFLVVQRPNSLDRMNYGAGEFWLSRLHKIFDVEVRPESISMPFRFFDTKLMYVVDNTEEHRGRILSYAAHDGNPSVGYAEPHHTIEYIYYTDSVYPDEIRETWYDATWKDGDDKPTMRIRKATTISVTSFSRENVLDDCSCESLNE